MAEDSNSVWQWVTLKEFQRPAVPAVITVKKWWQHVTQWLETEHEADDNEEQTSGFELHLDDAIDAFDSIFADWLADDGDRSLRWIITPPHSGLDKAIRQWASNQSITPLEIPSRDTLCHADAPPAPEFIKDSVWLMPQLAHTFLRQTNGLRWTREFFAQALSGDVGKGIIICDSWAWAFLEKVWPVPISQQWTLQGLDADALEHIGFTRGKERRQALAALSRGNPGIAAAYSNRYSQDKDKAFETPLLPQSADDATAFICYALLIHNGLTTQQLCQVLPIVSLNQVQIQLQVLQQQSLLEKQTGDDNGVTWYVSARGYPVVRDFLAARGFWLDAF